MPHGALEGPYGGMLWHGPSIVFNGFEEALSAPVYAHGIALGPGSCWGFPVSHACPTQRWRDHMVACFGTVLLLFLAVSKRRFRHPSTDAWHSPRARILLGFPCFACVPHGALEGTSHSCRNEQYCILTSIHVSIAAKANKDKKVKHVTLALPPSIHILSSRMMHALDMIAVA